MKQEKAGTEHTYFYDTYALIAIALGQDSYREYVKGIKIITTIVNLYELYYILQQESISTAERFFDKFLPNCVEIEPHLIKEAARFRLQNRKLKLSYADVLGYTIAQEKGVSFLTGDDGFRELQGVSFVK